MFKGYSPYLYLAYFSTGLNLDSAMRNIRINRALAFLSEMFMREYWKQSLPTNYQHTLLV